MLVYTDRKHCLTLSCVTEIYIYVDVENVVADPCKKMLIRSRAVAAALYFGNQNVDIMLELSLIHI